MKHRISFLFILLATTLAAQPSFITDSLDIFIEREMKRWNIPGVAVAIIKDTQVVKMKGYGVTDLESKTPVNEFTLFQIASNSKAFTATALAILEQQKKLELDATVKTYLPYFELKESYATNHTTVADLLSHKIGFQTFQGDFLHWGCKLDRKSLIERMKNLTPVYSFRETFGYSNTAFLTAGEIIPAVCDTSWDDYVRHRIFTPLKMTRSSTMVSEILKDKNACAPYTIQEAKLLRMKHQNIDNLGPAASINSCVSDLSKWLIMQINNGKFEGRQVISPVALSRTREPRTIIGSGNTRNKNYFQLYGLGWFMKDYHGSQVIWHDGGADGFVTTTCFLPQEKIGITILTNTDANSMYSILREMIIDAYLGRPYRNRSAEVYAREILQRQANQKELDDIRKTIQKKKKWNTELKQLNGTYTNEVYGKITISEKDGKPFITFENHPQMSAVLEYVEEDKFFCTYSSPLWGIKIAEVTKVGNAVKGIKLSVNDFVDYMSYYFSKD